MVGYVGFDSDNAYDLACQIKEWQDKQPKFEVIDLKFTSDSYITGSAGYIHSEPRVHAILLYKEIPAYPDCPPIRY